MARSTSTAASGLSAAIMIVLSPATVPSAPRRLALSSAAETPAAPPENVFTTTMLLCNQFGYHALEPHFLRENVIALTRLHQAHVHDVAGDRGLSAFVTSGLQLIGEIALRLDIMFANDVANDVVPLLTFSHALDTLCSRSRTITYGSDHKYLRGVCRIAQDPTKICIK